MSILASLGRGLGSWLGLPTGLLPTASLPGLAAGEQVPQVRVVTAPANPAPAAPVAGKPGELIRRNPDWVKKMTVTDYIDMKIEQAVRKAQSPNPASLQARAALAKSKPVAKSITPEVDTDDVPVPPPAKKDDDADENDPALATVIDQLTKLLDALKKRVQPDALEAALEVSAMALLRGGKKQSACRALMDVTKRLCQRGLAREKLSPEARASLAISEQPTVAALQAALRPRVAPVATTTAKASTDPLARHREIDAEVAALDKLQQRGFSNEINAKHSALRREQAALRKQFRAS